MRKIIESEHGAVYEGTPIRVADIKQALAGGRPRQKILATYPALDGKDLDAAVAWGSEKPLNKDIGPTDTTDTTDTTPKED